MRASDIFGDRIIMFLRFHIGEIMGRANFLKTLGADSCTQFFIYHSQTCIDVSYGTDSRSGISVCLPVNAYRSRQILYVADLRFVYALKTDGFQVLTATFTEDGVYDQRRFS
jgi:hypothetical protein